jgi:hypothetical protein
MAAVEKETAAGEDGGSFRPSPARARHRGWTGLTVLLLCLVALLGAAHVSTAVFDRVPHVEDELAFLFQARTIASGRLVASPPPLPEFFEAPFIIVQEDKWFGKYPPGHPAAMALGVLIGHPWLANPIFGALCVGLLFLLARRWYGTLTGLVAAALLVVSPFFLLQAGSMMSHVTSLFWTLVFLLAFDAARRGGSIPWAVAAGAAIGMLFLSRSLTAVAMGLPVALWAAADLLATRRRFWTYLAITVAFLPFLAALLAYNWYTTGDPVRSAYELWWPYDRVGFGPGVGMVGNHTVENGLIHTRDSLDKLSSYLFGWPDRLSLLPALFAASMVLLSTWGRAAGEVALAVLKPRLARGMSLGRIFPASAGWDLLLIGVAVGLTAGYVAYWTNAPVYGPRYLFEAIGALVLLSARGLLQIAGLIATLAGAAAWIGKWVLARAGGRDGGTGHQDSAGMPGNRALLLPTVGVLALAAGLTAHAFTQFVPQEFDRWEGTYGIDRSGVRTVEASGITNALVFVERIYWTNYAPFFAQHAPSLDADIVYAIDHGEEHNRRLMALYPDRSYYSFSTLEGRLIPLEASAGY